MNRFQNWGLDPKRFRMAGYTALGCFVALILAWALRLEHPQWAGMSVWAASQPLRGQVFEKSAFRALGTLAGVVVGILLVVASGTSPWLLVTGLALWIGVCTWASNLQRGIAGYGTALAGYSAAMVALLDTAHPDKVFALGTDRFLTVLTGVAVATLIGAIFAAKTEPARLTSDLRALVAKALRVLSGPTPSAPEIETILREIAHFEEGLEPHAAGGTNARAFVKTARRVLLELTLQLLRQPSLNPAERATVAARADAILEGETVAPLPEPPLQMTDLFALLTALRDQAPGAFATARIDLHQDRRGAREAALRSGGVILAVGAIWLLTGWPQLTYLLLGLSVMLSVFSSMELPVFMLRHVIVGQALAGVAAVICQMLLWALATSTLVQIVMMFPFILMGVLLSAHRKTFLAAFDYQMVFLLLMMPRIPYLADFGHAVTTALAVVAAPVLALLCFMTIFPVHLRRRAVNVQRMFDHDLAALAAMQNALSHRARWSSRFAHRSLRLLRLNEKLGLPAGQGVAQIQAYAQFGRAAFAAHETLAGPDAVASQRRLARQVLARLAQDPAPQMAGAALERLRPYAKEPLRSAMCA